MIIYDIKLSIRSSLYFKDNKWHRENDRLNDRCGMLCWWLKKDKKYFSIIYRLNRNLRDIK